MPRGRSGAASGFAFVVVLTLGLGIGANTAFFSIINAALIRPLGYTDEDRLVSVQEGFSQRGIDRFPFSALDFDDFRRYQQSFERAAAYRNVPFEVSGGDNPERIEEGAKVSADLFRTLGIGPTVGRSFSMAEDRPGVNVAILSWGLWQRRYAANPSIVGQSIQLDRQPYTVIGIMPATFVFPGVVLNSTVSPQISGCRSHLRTRTRCTRKPARQQCHRTTEGRNPLQRLGGTRSSRRTDH